MTIHNTEVAKLFNQLADLLEIESANPFRIRAYRNAALVISGLSRNLADMLKEDKDLTEIPGIGDAIAEKIKVIIATGELPQLKEVQKRLPAILSDLMQIESLGPKRVKILYQELNIHNLRDLQQALTSGEIEKLRGFGAKTTEKIKTGIMHLGEYELRIRLADAIPIVASLITYLKKSSLVKNIECAGSYRRHKETIGDLDLLATARQGKAVIEHFVKFDEIETILSKGTTRSTVRLHSGIQVDLRVVPHESYGAALIYFTGSKAHNISIRKIAVKKKLKMNEYGVFKGKKQLVGKTEAEVFAQIGLPYIEPELREDRGEIAAAKKNVLPQLINLNDIRGDLHGHTKATDGKHSLEEMANFALQLGYEYLAITDHSRRLAMTHGLDKKTLFQQIKLIDRLNAKLKNITILKSIELDILEDGKLDLPNAILKELDLTVCSIHSKFNLSLKKQTERIIRAMDNPYFNILAHPTGRLINKREPYEIDMDRIMRAAKERNCVFEVNAQPERLDLNDVYCKMAKEMGFKLAICTDAHTKEQLNYMEFGIYQARRGWLEAKDVINTYNLKELRQLIKR